MKKIILFTIFTFVLLNANEVYCATEPIKGNVCTGFIIESCKHVQIDAIKDDDGNLFEPKRCYDSVTEYSESKNLCWIHTKSKNWGALSWAINSISQPNFLHKNQSGELEEIDVEYIVFKCEKVLEKNRENK